MLHTVRAASDPASALQRYNLDDTKKDEKTGCGCGGVPWSKSLNISKANKWVVQSIIGKGKEYVKAVPKCQLRSCRFFEAEAFDPNNVMLLTE